MLLVVEEAGRGTRAAEEVELALEGARVGAVTAGFLETPEAGRLDSSLLSSGPLTLTRALLVIGVLLATLVLTPEAGLLLVDGFLSVTDELVLSVKGLFSAIAEVLLIDGVGLTLFPVGSLLACFEFLLMAPKFLLDSVGFGFSASFAEPFSLTTLLLGSVGSGLLIGTLLTS